MTRLKTPFLLCAAGLLLSGCVVLPSGPSVLVLPGSGRSVESFRNDESMCRDYAYQQIGGRTAAQAANDSAAGSAVVGTVIGAAAGAALGGGGRGAAAGAGAGLLVGSAVGADNSYRSGYGTQRQYDNAYIQCMYGQGHRVPVPANMAYPKAARPGDAGIPPPPPGSPPPPPPGR